MVGERHHCAVGTALPAPLAPPLVPSSGSIDTVHPDWEPAEHEKWICTFKPCIKALIYATWEHKDGSGHGLPWSACDEHVPRIGGVGAAENAFTEIEPEAPTPLPEYDGTFVGPQKAELIHSLKLGMHCLLVGPTATGKSLCATEAFAHADESKSVLVIEGHESLREADLLGSFIPSEGHFVWVDGILTEAMRKGAYLFIDEANRMPTRTLNVLLGVLSRGAVRLTEHGSEEVECADGFQVVMAMNLGKAYAVNGRDRALMSRFDCKLQYTYLPSAQEERLLISKAGIDATVARKMVKVANETRKLRKERQLEAEIDPRGLFAWARKCKAHGAYDVKTMVQAAEVTWMLDVAGTDADGYLHEENAGTLRSLIEAHS